MGQDLCKECYAKHETDGNMYSHSEEDKLTIIPHTRSNKPNNLKKDDGILENKPGQIEKFIVKEEKRDYLSQKGMTNGRYILEENVKGNIQRLNHELSPARHQPQKEAETQKQFEIPIIEDKPDHDLPFRDQIEKENLDEQTYTNFWKAPDCTSFLSSNFSDNKSSALRSRYAGGLSGPNLETRNGFGILKWEDKTKYVGIFKNNKANGWGKLRHSEGFNYNGEFCDDKAQGFGQFRSAEGEEFIGYWEEDRQHGVGIETLPNSHEYKGMFSNGTFIWPNGAKYEGEWANNSMTGWGIHYFVDGNRYMGEWKNNLMEGYGEFYWTDGKIYVGYYKSDKKEGFGLLFSRETKIYMGFWKNNKQDGFGMLLKNNSSQYGQWVNGKTVLDSTAAEEAMKALKSKENKYRKLFMKESSQILSFFAKIGSNNSHHELLN